MIALSQQEFIWDDDHVTLSKPVDWTNAKVGDVVEAPMAYCGLSEELSKKSALRLYVRQTCVDLFNFLRDSTGGVMKVVTGCPGVGKSVEVFSYAMWYGLTQNKRVLYIHSGNMTISLLFKYESHSDQARVSTIYKDFSKDSDALLVNLVRKVLQECTADLIVLDGDLASVIQMTYRSMPRGKNLNVTLITCTSFQAFGKISQEAYFELVEPERFQMDSWSEPEYKAAIENGAITLPEGVTLEEIYFYAGGCVRLLQLPVQQIINFLTTKLLGVPNYDLLLSGAVGTQSANAVNSLIAIFGKSSTILSQYVARSLADSLSDEFVEKARNAVADNPVWQGWVTELEFRKLIKGKTAITVRSETGNETWNWKRHTIYTFYDASDEVFRIQDTGWFWPQRWNQKCFDALYLVSAYELRVIQITDAVTHSCDLNSLIPYVQAMGVYVVDFVFVCREHNFEAFQLPAPKTKLINNALTTERQRVNQPSDSRQAEIHIRKVSYEIK